MKLLASIAAIAAIATILPSPICLSQQVTQQPPTFLMLGVGDRSCGTFLAATEGMPLNKAQTYTSPDGRLFWSENKIYGEWIQGYISGVNMVLASDPFRSGGGQYDPSKQIAVDYSGTELWLRKWCDAHPAESLLTAVNSFIVSRWGVPR
jgi:hypothetical protein